MARTKSAGGSPEDRPPRYISAAQIDDALAWASLVAALEQGHRLSRAGLGDLLLEEGGSAMLSRAAWLADTALGIKSVTVFPDNPQRQPARPSVQGVFISSSSTGTTAGCAR
jgi:ornithine cyclodeaminase